MLAYPGGTEAIEAGTLIATDLRSGTLFANKTRFCAAVWNVQGFVQKQTVGDYVESPLFGATEDECEQLASVFAGMESALVDAGHLEEVAPATYGASGIRNIDWEKWAKILLPLLLKLLAEQK